MTNDDIDLKKLIRDLNEAVGEAKKVRQMPTDLWHFIIKLTKKLSQGMHTQSDIENAQEFLKAFGNFMEKNQETIESVKKQVDEETKDFWKPEKQETNELILSNTPVETPIIRDIKSQIIH